MTKKEKFFIFVILFFVAMSFILWYGTPEPASRGIGQFGNGKEGYIMALYLYGGFAFLLIYSGYDWDVESKTKELEDGIDY